jgi:leukotriene-A4 hydrolase
MRMRHISGSTRVSWTVENVLFFSSDLGWTTYMERVLAEKIHGPAERGFSFIIGRKALTDALANYKDKPKYQRLYIEFERGEDPDDAYSTVPYEKGANFLLHLGEHTGTGGLK